MDQKRLLTQLAADDQDVRREAREELHMLMDDTIARAYLDVIEGSAPEDVRADAIVGLGPVIEEAGMDYFDDDVELESMPELGPPVSREVFDTIITTVRRIYEDESQPKVVRRRALEVLVRDPQPWLEGEIRNHATSSDADWKLTAVFAMGYVNGFEKEITEAVHGAEEPILFEAVRSAGSQEIKATAKRIRELAQSESIDPDTRLAAIEALPFVDSDCEEILQELISSENEEVAQTAEAALDELQMWEGIDDEDDEEEELDED